jgi:hypothetical protein
MTKKLREWFQDTDITVIDGSIIGGPPRQKPNVTQYHPTLGDTQAANLDDIFEIIHIGLGIGQASTLKCHLRHSQMYLDCVQAYSRDSQPSQSNGLRVATARANGLLESFLK